MQFVPNTLGQVFAQHAASLALFELREADKIVDRLEVTATDCCDVSPIIDVERLDRGRWFLLFVCASWGCIFSRGNVFSAHRLFGRSAAILAAGKIWS